MWGNGEPQSGYFDAELLDGRRGLVPASFVQRLVGKYMSWWWIGICMAHFLLPSFLLIFFWNHIDFVLFNVDGILRKKKIKKLFWWWQKCIDVSISIYLSLSLFPTCCDSVLCIIVSNISPSCFTFLLLAQFSPKQKKIVRFNDKNAHFMIMKKLH